MTSLGLKENFSRTARYLNIVEIIYGTKITLTLPILEAPQVK